MVRPFETAQGPVECRPFALRALCRRVIARRGCDFRLDTIRLPLIEQRDQSLLIAIYVRDSNLRTWHIESFALVVPPLEQFDGF